MKIFFTNKIDLEYQILYKLIFDMRNSIDMETILRYTRFAMYGLTIKILIQLVFLAIYFIIFGSAEQNIRGLNMKEISLPTPIPCNHGTIGSNCTCPANCLFYSGETGGCHPIDCWYYSIIKNECNEAGKPFAPAIILQAIPFTGAFGSGFGNMGRWDIFGTYMAIVFGGFVLLCCFTMITSVAHLQSDEEVSGNGVKCCINCSGCIWALAILTMWIWGIVVIANKEIDAPWTDYRGDAIKCPLV